MEGCIYREQARIETEKYKKEQEEKTVLILFHADREMEYGKEKLYTERITDGTYADISQLSADNKCSLYYKVIPYDGKEVSRNLIITYSTKYAAYYRSVRAAQIARAEKMPENGVTKKQRRNPNDPARFIGKAAVTQDGEAADIRYYLDEEKIAEEEKYDGLYAVCTDLLDDPVEDILR